MYISGPVFLCVSPVLIVTSGYVRQGTTGMGGCRHPLDTQSFYVPGIPLLVAVPPVSLDNHLPWAWEEILRGRTE
jgi:hypothetical protein